MNYEELVKALRVCNRIDHVGNCNECYYGSPDAPPPKQYVNGCKRSMCEDAAAAIEALQAQLPKRGEWLPYEFNTNGTWHKCSVCGVAYQYKDAPNSGWWINHNYCPNCGAKMTEVQDA